jgi:hypothetical protein
MNTKSNLTKKTIKLNKLIDNREVNLLNGEYNPYYVLELKVIYKIIKKIINDNIYKLNPIEITKNKLIKIRPINIVDYNFTYPEVYSGKAFIISIDKKLNKCLLNDLQYYTIKETDFIYKDNEYTILHNFPKEAEILNNRSNIKDYKKDDIHLYITLYYSRRYKFI